MDYCSYLFSILFRACACHACTKLQACHAAQVVSALSAFKTYDCPDLGQIRFIAQQMLDFYYSNSVAPPESKTGAVAPAAVEGTDRESLAAGRRSVNHFGEDHSEGGRTPEVGDECSDVSANLAGRWAALDLGVGRSGEMGSEGGGEVDEAKAEENDVAGRAGEEVEDDSWMESDVADNEKRPVLSLPPLSGPHLDAAKKLAQYARLAFEEKGGGESPSKRRGEVRRGVSVGRSWLAIGYDASMRSRRLIVLTRFG